jgi:hypothetical protein
MRFETSPVSICEPIAFLDGLLDPGAYEDHGPNGLQHHDIVHEFVDIPNPV